MIRERFEQDFTSVFGPADTVHQQYKEAYPDPSDEFQRGVCDGELIKVMESTKPEYTAGYAVGYEKAQKLGARQ